MRRSLPLLLLLGACCASPAQTVEQRPAAPQPTAEAGAVREPARPPGPELNPYVLSVLQRYPVDGSHAYYWPREGSWEGTTQDLVYAGTRLTQGDPLRRSFCCGLTFEVYVRALLEAAGGPVEGLSAADLHELRLRFFGDSAAGERRRLCQFGFESLRLGAAVAELSQARAGDFIQFWRDSGSGHSAIFINWEWKGDEIVGLTYWSSQSSTRGIGYHSERIGPGGIRPDELYLARASWPLRR